MIIAPRRIVAALTAITCLASIAAQTASAQCQYEVTAIIEGPQCGLGGAAALFGRGMNSHGHVAGSWQRCLDASDEAFYWTPQTGVVTLPRPSGVSSARASDINDAGLVTGGHAFSGIGWKGFIYDPATEQFTYLQPLHDGVAATNLTTLNAINNSGIAVGSRVISKPGTPIVSNAVIWNTNTGEVIDLGVGEGPNSIAVDGNNTTDAAGWSGSSQVSSNVRALAWFDRTMLHLGILPGMVSSQSKHLNAHREVVGLSSPQSGIGLHFFWVDGRMDPIMPPKGYDAVGTADYSDTRQMTGHIRVEGTSTFHPFLWQHGVFYNLQDLIIDAPPEITIDAGVVIQETGPILARAATRAVLLTPKDQPVGDLNHDCHVDVHDLLILLAAWGPAPLAAHQSTSPADLNGDGAVDVSDLLILLANWSQ